MNTNVFTNSNNNNINNNTRVFDIVYNSNKNITQTILCSINELLENFDQKQANFSSK